MKTEIDKLVSRAAKAVSASDALHFSQAALNIAHAAAVLKGLKSKR